MSSELTTAVLHAAISEVNPKFLTGQTGFRLLAALPSIVAALQRRLCTACYSCGTAVTDETAYERNGVIRCKDCHRAAVALSCAEEADDCTPSEHFMGGGKRVVRKTGGLGG